MGRPEKFLFQAEAKQLLDLMIHSVYSNRDIFLRELISNASDALDKRRLELLARPGLAGDGREGSLREPEIRVFTGEGPTLTVSDNGVGMNREELPAFLGTIAKSGTREFVEATRRGGAEGSPDAEALIGQFGVGFYSSFMVASRVDVLTRRLGEEDGWLFSSEGDGTYSIEEASRPEPGTTVTLHLKKVDPSRGDRDYSQAETLRRIIRKYSDFISYPIVMPVTRTREGRDETTDETVNSRKAIWRRPEKDVTEEEYREFFRHQSHDWNEPLARIAFTVEGGTEFRGLLYIPSRAPFGIHFSPHGEGVSLYIRNVFIMNDCREIVPSFLRFLRGVVDSEDLPLNISREILQEAPLLRVIRKNVTRRVLNFLKGLMGDDREKYGVFWKEFGQVLKEGLVPAEGVEEETRNVLLDLCLFHSAASPDGKLISLREYRNSMQEGQERIYFLTGRDLHILRSSPLLEKARSSGHDVLLMEDPVDEVAMSSCSEYDGKGFLSLEKSDAFPSEGGAPSAEEGVEGTAIFFREALGETVKDVRISTRLTDSPACLVTDGDTGTFAMERILRSMGEKVPQARRVLEINPSHGIIRSLGRILAGGPGEEELQKLKEYAFLLYDQCLLLEGGQPENPVLFCSRIASLLADILEGPCLPGKP